MDRLLSCECGKCYLMRPGLDDACVRLQCGACGRTVDPAPPPPPGPARDRPAAPPPIPVSNCPGAADAGPWFAVRARPDPGSADRVAVVCRMRTVVAAAEVRDGEVPVGEMSVGEAFAALDDRRHGADPTPLPALILDALAAGPTYPQAAAH